VIGIGVIIGYGAVYYKFIVYYGVVCKTLGFYFILNGSNDYKNKSVLNYIYICK